LTTQSFGERNRGGEGAVGDSSCSAAVQGQRGLMAAAETARRAPADDAAGLAGLLAFVDTAYGVLPAMFFDWTRPIDIAFGISFLIPFPAYLLDRRSKLRVVVFLPLLLLTRWLMSACTGVPGCNFRVIWTTDGLLSPGWGNRMLFAACALLQWSKARRGSQIAVRADS
jgi:hypothetical protein